ncbi:hypothetical protein LSTR_LSTR015931 [Laodelphax striatellus]|uniref:Uncharacterized protein n=1 Tax=Laodelphax striatellus TaxID=195883 RepID=A0A482X588_LAOST|nr:hypothetical protein LSTR_LSTR015931 [Laodelphax striatellus]
MYVRYVLMFKVWKKIVRGVEQRKRINQLASSRLTPPDHFREAIKQGALSDVLPKVPSSKAKNITDYYMVSKFDVKEKIQRLGGRRPINHYRRAAGC